MVIIKPTKNTQSSHSLSLKHIKKSVPKSDSQESISYTETREKKPVDKTKKTTAIKPEEKTEKETQTQENILESNTSATVRRCIGYVNFTFFLIENIVFMFISDGIYKALNNDCYEKDGIKKKYVGLTYTCSGLTFVSQSPSFVKIILIAILIASFLHLMSYIFASYGFWFSSSINVKVHACLLITSSLLLLISLLVADILEANLNSYFNISLTIAVASLVIFSAEIFIYMVSIVLLRYVFKFKQLNSEIH